MTTPGLATAAERAVDAHRDRWGAPELVVRAPGRVNLIGDHTDYNDGFTMPMALPFDTVIAMSSGGDHRLDDVVICSAGFGQVTISATTNSAAVPAWAKHLWGVVELLGDHGVDTFGWRATLDSDVPVGAGLSSSAALEVAAITALLARAGMAWPPVEVARLGQRIENEIVGLQSGIMDQFISAGAIAGHASLMDCRALTLTPAPLPDEVVVAVMDTGTRRVLAEVAYDDRRAACERAVANLGTSLRDASVDEVAAIADEVTRRRARHVVTENARTLAAAEALRRNDVVEFGRLMIQSHASLRDDYEVSGLGLDMIVDAALESPGCLGARMTGGGFAGCAVALVRADHADAFARSVTDAYDFDGHVATVWMCSPAAGASQVMDVRSADHEPSHR